MALGALHQISSGADRGQLTSPDENTVWKDGTAAFTIGNNTELVIVTDLTADRIATLPHVGSFTRDRLIIVVLDNNTLNRKLTVTNHIKDVDHFPSTDPLIDTSGGSLVFFPAGICWTFFLQNAETPDSAT